MQTDTARKIALAVADREEELSAGTIMEPVVTEDEKGSAWVGSRLALTPDETIVMYLDESSLAELLVALEDGGVEQCTRLLECWAQ